ncbi:MAG: S-layer homology domain-containing protein [Defluviitaleaceae bacterium]|nr:S-layer homology domain-containing protein [Defluviitaleaceae bacterium]
MKNIKGFPLVFIVFIFTLLFAPVTVRGSDAEEPVPVPAVNLTLDTTAGQLQVPFDLGRLVTVHPANAIPGPGDITWEIISSTVSADERELIGNILTVWSEGTVTVRGTVDADDNGDATQDLVRAFTLTFSVGVLVVELEGLDELFVGVPAAGEVRFSLRSAVFLPEIFEQDFRVIGLPAGLRAGTPRRMGDTLVVLPISGTPMWANENATVFTLPDTLPARNVLRGGQPLGISPTFFTLPPIQPSATLRRYRAVFDLNPANLLQHRDIQMNLNANEHSLRAVMYGNYRLIEGVDFTLLANDGFQIHTRFLRQLPIGEWPLTFDMRQGASPNFLLEIIDTRIPTREDPQPGAGLDMSLLNPPSSDDTVIFMGGAAPLRLDALGLDNGWGIIRPAVQGGRASFWLRADVLEFLAWRYPHAIIEAQTRLGSLRFPTFLLDILRGAKAAIAEQRLEYDQVYVRITLTDMSQNTRLNERIQNTFPGGQALAPLVDVTIELIRRSDLHVFFTVREFTRPIEWVQMIMPPAGILRYGAFWFNPSPSRMEFAPHRAYGDDGVVIRSIYTGVHGIVNNGTVVTDVPFPGWGFVPANTAAYKGLVQPVGGRINPGSILTRGVFVQLLSFALQLPSSGFIPEFYNDIPVSHGAYDAVSRARYAGLLDGEETFRPNEPITRQEMITMIAKAINRSVPVLPPQDRPLALYFTDYRDIATHFVLGVQTALNHGIFIGFPDATLRPNAAASHMEAVSMVVALARVMGYIDWDA